MNKKYTVYFNDLDGYMEILAHNVKVENGDLIFEDMENVIASYSKGNWKSFFSNKSDCEYVNPFCTIDREINKSGLTDIKPPKEYSQ
jgi:hypothetical protein